VAEQHGRRAEVGRRRLQGGVARRARRRLGAAAAVNRHRDRAHRVESKAAKRRRDRRGPVGRPVLESVIDGDRAGPEPGPRRDERERGRQRERVGTARAGGQHQVARR